MWRHPQQQQLVSVLDCTGHLHHVLVLLPCCNVCWTQPLLLPQVLHSSLSGTDLCWCCLLLTPHWVFPAAECMPQIRTLVLKQTGQLAPAVLGPAFAGLVLVLQGAAAVGLAPALALDLVLNCCLGCFVGQRYHLQPGSDQQQEAVCPALLLQGQVHADREHMQQLVLP